MWLLLCFFVKILMVCGLDSGVFEKGLDSFFLFSWRFLIVVFVLYWVFVVDFEGLKCRLMLMFEFEVWS